MNRVTGLVGLLFVVLLSLLPGAESYGAGVVPRIVMVVADKDFTDHEYFDTRAVFDRVGAKVLVCSPSGTLAVSHNGRQLPVDSRIESVSPMQLDAIVVVGGAGVVSSLLNSSSLLKLVADAEHAGKLVAAICIAPMVLAKAGLLRGVTATCYSDPTVVRQLKANGASYVDKKVVVTGRIVTANGPSASTEFGQTIAKLLGKS